MFVILSREMDAIGRAVDSGGEDLRVLETDISAAIRGSIGITCGKVGDSVSLSSA